MAAAAMVEATAKAIIVVVPILVRKAGGRADAAMVRRSRQLGWLDKGGIRWRVAFVAVGLLLAMH